MRNCRGKVLHARLDLESDRDQWEVSPARHLWWTFVAKRIDFLQSVSETTCSRIYHPQPFFFFFRLSLRPDTLLRIIEHIWAYDLKSINIFSLTQTHTPSSFKPQLSSFVSHITFIVDLGCCIWKVKCSRHDDPSGRMYGEQMGCGVNVFVFVLFEDFYTVWISWWHFHTKRPYWCVCLSSWHEPTTTGTNCS